MAVHQDGLVDRVAGAHRELAGGLGQRDTRRARLRDRRRGEPSSESSCTPSATGLIARCWRARASGRPTSSAVYLPPPGQRPVRALASARRLTGADRGAGGLHGRRGSDRRRLSDARCRRARARCALAADLYGLPGAPGEGIEDVAGQRDPLRVARAPRHRAGRARGRARSAGSTSVVFFGAWRRRGPGLAGGLPLGVCLPGREPHEDRVATLPQAGPRSHYHVLRRPRGPPGRSRRVAGALVGAARQVLRVRCVSSAPIRPRREREPPAKAPVRSAPSWLDCPRPDGSLGATKTTRARCRSPSTGGVGLSGPPARAPAARTELRSGCSCSTPPTSRSTSARSAVPPSCCSRRRPRSSSKGATGSCAPTSTDAAAARWSSAWCTYVRVPRDTHRCKITRRAVFARDGWECQYCGDARQPHRRPRRPTLQGRGTSSWENIVASCAPCNRRKGDKPRPQGRRHAPAPPHRASAPARTPSSTWPAPTIPAAWHAVPSRGVLRGSGSQRRWAVRRRPLTRTQGAWRAPARERPRTTSAGDRRTAQHGRRAPVDLPGPFAYNADWIDSVAFPSAPRTGQGRGD